MNAVNPIAVSYTNLPDGLTADNASFQGTISTIGLYTFSLTIGDALGYRIQTFLTLNIQPKDINISSSTLADVPLRNTAYDIDTIALQAAQTGAANTAKNALQKAISAQNNVTMVQNSLYSTANNLVLAQQASLSYQQAYTDALQNLNSLQTFINNGQAAIQSYTIQSSVGNTSLGQANATLASALSTYNTALSSSQNYSIAFNTSVSNMAIASKASSDANT
jgi:hypothetical protein